MDQGGHGDRGNDYVWDPSGVRAYATLEQPGTGNHAPESSFEKWEQLDKEWERHDAGVLALLSEHSGSQSWWLGYLETGASDLPFDGAQRVRFYADWPYVLLEAGPEQAVPGARIAGTESSQI